MTYQVPVSTSVKTSTPLRAKAPFEMLRLTTRPLNGARTRVNSRSSSAECNAASAAATRTFTFATSPTASSARARSLFDCRSAAFVERGVGSQHGRPRLFGSHGGRDSPRAGFVHTILGHELLGQQRLEPGEVVFGVPQFGPGTHQRRF